MKQYNGEKYIVSFTTFPERYKYAAMMVFGLLAKQSYKDIHIVATLFKDDYTKLTGDFKRIIDADKIEVIVAEENLRPHLKYYYAMQKYNDKPIITVDDDRVYSSNTIAGLVSKYESLTYKSVVSICAPKMKLDVRTKQLVPYDSWCTGWQRLRPNEKSYVAMAEGFGSVLYPASAFNMSDISLNELKTCLLHDDLYLKVLELRNKIPVTQVNGRLGYEFTSYNIEGTQQHAIALHVAEGSKLYRERVTKQFEQWLLRGFLYDRQ